MKTQPASDLAVAPGVSSRARRRQRITAVAVAVAFVSSGVVSCTRTEIAVSTAGIAAALVVTTVGVTYAVKSHNHNLQGCVFSDAGGLKLRASDARVYTLKGAVAGIKEGDSMKFRGSREKKTKGAASGDQVFVVQKLSKDYGPCPANVAASRNPAG